MQVSPSRPCAPAPPKNLKTYTSQCSAGQICSEGDGGGNTEHSALLLILGVEPGCLNLEAAVDDARGHLVATLGTASRSGAQDLPPSSIVPSTPGPVHLTSVQPLGWQRSLYLLW